MDMAPGSIKTLVDLLPYTLKVENITESSGGMDRETDNELAERVIWLRLSTAQQEQKEPMSIG